MNVAAAYDPVRALTASWRLLLRSPLPLFVGGALLVLLDDGFSSGLKFHEDGHRLRGEIVAAALFIGCTCGLVGLLLGSWLTIGLANAVEKTITTGGARFEELFVSKGRFFDMVLLRILVLLIVIAALVPFGLCVLGGIAAHELLKLNEGPAVLLALLAAVLYLPVFLYIALGYSLSVQAVAIEGLSPTNALRRSWSLVHENRLRLLLYWIVMAVFTMLGLCLCCVGVFWTGAMAHVAANDSYLALVKADDYERSWLMSPDAPVSPTVPPPVPPPAPPAPPAPPPAADVG